MTRYDARVAAVPARRPATLIGQILAFVAVLNRPRDMRKARAWAAGLVVAGREHVTTVVALAAIDLGAFQASRVAGWIVLGVCLLVADWKIRG
jgi:hypothetical protein